MRNAKIGIAILAAFSVASCSKPPQEAEPSRSPAAAQAPSLSASDTKAPTVVNFPGGGQAEFPAGMSQKAIDQITNAIRKQKQLQADTSSALSPGTAGARQSPSPQPQVSPTPAGSSAQGQ